MTSNRFKRNIWLALAITGVGITILRTIDVITGDKEWWQLLSAICLSFVALKIYLSYRKAVKEGNLSGPVNLSCRK